MNEKKTLFSNIYVIAAVALAVITAGLLFLSGPTKGNSPEGVLNRAQQAMNKRDTKALTACYDSETRELAKYFNVYQLDEIFYDGADDEDLQYQYIVVSEEKDETDDNYTKLKCIRIVKNKEEKTSDIARETINFIKEDGKWYIQN